MDRVAIDLGFVKIYWYSIFIFTGMVLACTIIFKEAKRRKLDEDFLVNLIFYSIIFGIIGARTYYVVFNLPYYLKNPLEIFAIWEGGLAIHGGILFGLLAIIYQCKKHKVNILEILDITVVGIIIAQAIGRWGNFFNSEAYGRITSKEALKKGLIPNFIINGMLIEGKYREPTFYYESIGCLIGFIILYAILKKKKTKTGTLTGIYLIWYGIIRFIIEALRSDSLMLGTLKVAQLVSLIFIISGSFLLIKNISQKYKDKKINTK